MVLSVFLFVPNIICYIRATLSAVSFCVMRSNYVVAFWCYVISVALDEVDGNIARALNQCSRFGAILDMLVDRFSNLGMLMMLSLLYPDYFVVCLFILSIEVLGTWLHMHSKLCSGSTSHKDVSTIKNPVMRMYYGKLWFMNINVYGQEAFWILLYLNHFSKGPEVSLLGHSCGFYTLLCLLLAPIQLMKIVVNIVQLCVAANNVVAMDRQELATKQQQ